MKGVPVRLEIGPKDIEQDQCVLVTRLQSVKTFCPLSQLVETVQERLQAVHDGMYEKALENRAEPDICLQEHGRDPAGLEEKAMALSKQCGAVMKPVKTR